MYIYIYINQNLLFGFFRRRPLAVYIIAARRLPCWILCSVRCPYILSRIIKWILQTATTLGPIDYGQYYRPAHGLAQCSKKKWQHLHAIYSLSVVSNGHFNSYSRYNIHVACRRTSQRLRYQSHQQSHCQLVTCSIYDASVFRGQGRQTGTYKYMIVVREWILGRTTVLRICRITSSK